MQCVSDMKNEACVVQRWQCDSGGCCVGCSRCWVAFLIVASVAVTVCVNGCL